LPLRSNENILFRILLHGIVLNPVDWLLFAQDHKNAFQITDGNVQAGALEKLGKPDARRNYNEKESGEVVEIYEYKMVPAETPAVPFARAATAVLALGASSLAENPSSNYAVRILCVLREGRLIEWKTADN